MAAEEPDEAPKSAQDARLGTLEERLRQAERVEKERRPAVIQSATDVRSAGMRVAQSLVGMPLGGAIVGWVLDRFFDTAPWIMLALMFIGFAGAVLDVVRTFGSGANKDAGK